MVEERKAGEPIGDPKVTRPEDAGTRAMSAGKRLCEVERDGDQTLHLFWFTVRPMAARWEEKVVKAAATSAGGPTRVVSSA
jgi:hypothetical protein